MSDLDRQGASDFFDPRRGKHSAGFKVTSIVADGQFDESARDADRRRDCGGAAMVSRGRDDSPRSVSGRE